MGVQKNVSHDEYPMQCQRHGQLVGDPVRICFNYNTDHMFNGKILRNDTEEPYMLIFQLDDGRVILATECMWKPAV